MDRHLQVATESDFVRILEGSSGARGHVTDAKRGCTPLESFLRLIPVALILLSLVLAGAGVVSLLFTNGQYHDVDVLFVDSPVKSFGNAPSGRRVAISFTLANRSSRAIRILGVTPYCGRHGCLSYDNLPLKIPPSSTRDLVVYAETREPGEFACNLMLFSDVPDQVQTVLGINGRVVEKDEEP